MFKELLSAMFLFSLITSIVSADTSGLNVVNPASGQVLKGTVEVKGTVSASEFSSASLSYAYADSQTDTWFLICSIDHGIEDGKICTWDTSLISDGNYKIRLSGNKKAGGVDSVIVEELQVRNYSAAVPTEKSIATQKPTLELNITPTVPAEISPAPVVTTPTVSPTVENQASITNSHLIKGIKEGAAIGVVCLIALGLYSLIRGWIYRR